MSAEPLSENPDFLTKDIITYIGNKRSLLGYIGEELDEIRGQLGKEKLVTADLFSGSGIVSRYLKKYSQVLYANDLENYSRVLNSCYLTNESSFDKNLYSKIKKEIEDQVSQNKIEGLFSKEYAPKNTEAVEKGERCFYTRENALLLDSYRFYIEELASPYHMEDYFLAPLLTQASVHTNTSGVFKGFYKDKDGKGAFGGQGTNALSRIMGTVTLPEPVFSNFDSEVHIFQKDAALLAGELKNLDAVYLDPPYNQHPYGSNYFMLNLILENKLPQNTKISRISGIPSNWNRSNFNVRKLALDSLEEIIFRLNTHFIIISYNSEGFISFDQMKEMLNKYGNLKTVEIAYNTFRGSRNLKQRNIHVSEYLFVLEKK